MPKNFYNIIKDHKSFLELSYSWGLLMTLLGLIVAIPFMLYCLFVEDISEHRGHCIYYRIGKGWGGFSLGPFCFICKDASTRTMEHEQGHSLQNCLYGPLMLVFSLCSVVRYHYRNFREYINKPCTSKYDDFWFEGQASKWGNELFNNAFKED